MLTEQFPWKKSYVSIWICSPKSLNALLPPSMVNVLGVSFYFWITWYASNQYAHNEVLFFELAIPPCNLFLRRMMWSITREELFVFDSWLTCHVYIDRILHLVLPFVFYFGFQILLTKLVILTVLVLSIHHWHSFVL